LPHLLPLAVTLLLYREYITEYSFKSSKEYPAAILELPDGAWKDKISKVKLDFMGGYFDRHAESWYDYYRKIHGYSIANSSLMIVNCTYKTKTWALAIYPSKSSRGNIFARIYKKRENTDWYEWETHNDVNGRSLGPELEMIGKETTDLPNQCVAVEVSPIALVTSNFKKSVSALTKVMSKISVVH